MKWTGWASLVVGLWLILAPFALGSTDGLWNDVSVGVVIVAAAASAAIAETASTAVTLGAVVGAAGLWVAIAPFFFAHAPVGARGWNDLAVGVVVLELAAARALNAGAPRRA
jgi:hypothetical protein